MIQRLNDVKIWTSTETNDSEMVSYQLLPNGMGWCRLSCSCKPTWFWVCKSKHSWQVDLQHQWQNWSNILRELKKKKKHFKVRVTIHNNYIPLCPQDSRLKLSWSTCLKHYLLMRIVFNSVVNLKHVCWVSWFAQAWQSCSISSLLPVLTLTVPFSYSKLERTSKQRYRYRDTLRQCWLPPAWLQMQCSGRNWPVVPLGARVPGSSQSGVDYDIYRHQVGHCVVGGPHRAKNALPRLGISRHKHLGSCFILNSSSQKLLSKYVVGKVEFSQTVSMHASDWHNASQSSERKHLQLWIFHWARWNYLSSPVGEKHCWLIGSTGSSSQTRDSSEW